MGNLYRFAPEFAFPAYRFQPGEATHPVQPGGHSHGVADPIAFSIDEAHVEKNECFRMGLDLLNHEYFWESHVYFEALWNAEGRQGDVADFLKALVKLGAAGVKLRAHQAEQAGVHLSRAKELFEVVKQNVGEAFLGFDLPELIGRTDLGLMNGKLLLPIYPSWK